MKNFNDVKLGIYIHIPFCIKKCNYCDFLSFQLMNEDEYIDALCKEIDSFERGYIAETVFLGGGTPSIIHEKNIIKIFNKLRKKFVFTKDSEISIELNPKTFTQNKLKTYKEQGINRLSIGCQTTNDTLLKKIGRVHTYQDFLIGYELARKEGFTNINVDIMAQLPTQTIQMHIKDLDNILKLNTEHISTYGLIIEEGTPFFILYNENEGTKLDELMKEDECIKLYETTNKRLHLVGLNQYEISNYAKVGYECRHNIKYWERENYVGFGLGASGCIGNIRYKNTDKFNEYLKCNYLREKEILTQEDINNEIIMLGLRLNKGIDKELLFNISDCGTIDNLIKENLLKEDDDKICLTDKARIISNYVIAKLMI